ncbi:MAG: DUF4388 domain-containing protein [Verrucomicrobia bacterium]|nr:DUF4388 domain-containing protein [Verrucomicrobiota bacterium]
MSPDRLAEAERLAAQQQMPLVRVLTSSLMMGYEDLGPCCEAITGLPYVALLKTAPVPEALRLLSPAYARQWKTVPVAVDVSQNLLTLAIHDPSQMQTLARLYKFLLQPYHLNFTIAPEGEIERACAKYYGVRGSKPHLKTASTSRPVLAKTKGAAQRPRQEEVSPPAAAARAASNGKDIPAGGGREPTYADMSQALISAATLLVRLHFGEEPDRIHDVRACVRYCQLMASRLRFTAVQVDALVLAAWLSMLEHQHGLVRQLAAPYQLDEVLFVDSPGNGRSGRQRPEAQVLSLVKCHQDLKAKEPNISRDLNLTRRELRLKWSSAPELQDMLETFLQVLVDEEFLDRLSVSAGRILIVDPEELSRCELAPPLMGMGYDVIAVPDVPSAEELMTEFKPDLILMSIDAENSKSFWLCERLKTEPKTAAIPVLAVLGVGKDRLAVSCLRAGASDFLTRPVNSELLYLKVQGYFTTSGVELKECGVSGSLDEMSFTDMIQILCAGRRNVDIILTSAKDEGRVFIREGEVTHAAVGSRVGASAFYAMMGWEEGVFTTRQCGETPDRTIHVSAMSLLMEGARQVDEQREVRA